LFKIGSVETGLFGVGIDQIGCQRQRVLSATLIVILGRGEEGEGQGENESERFHDVEKEG